MFIGRDSQIEQITGSRVSVYRKEGWESMESVCSNEVDYKKHFKQVSKESQLEDCILNLEPKILSGIETLK